jgi:hypothetical protein
MKKLYIPFDLLKSKIYTEKESRHGWFENQTEIDDKDISLLMLCILFHNNKISQKSFTARTKQYFETIPNSSGGQVAKLSRKLGTYKSEILDKWYTDICLTNVLVDEVVETCDIKDLTVEQYLKYLNLGLNRNKNFCINIIAVSIFLKVIDSYNKDWAYDFLNSCGVEGLNLTHLSFEQADRDYDLEFGYCCSDCDGCLRQYKESRYNYYYKKGSTYDLKKQFKALFLGMKTHNRNEHDMVLYSY